MLVIADVLLSFLRGAPHPQRAPLKAMVSWYLPLSQGILTPTSGKSSELPSSGAVTRKTCHAGLCHIAGSCTMLLVQQPWPPRVELGFNPGKWES